MAKRKEQFISAAKTILEEFGGGPVATRTLVAAAIEQGLVDPESKNKWVYNHFTKAIRDSEEFDTSARGQVSLALASEPVPPVVDVPVPDVPVEAETPKATSTESL